MSKEEKSLTISRLGVVESSKNDLALCIAEKRFDAMTTAEQLGSSLIGYNIIPIRLMQILSYFFCVDSLMTSFFNFGPGMGVSHYTALPLFIFYILMEAFVKSVNREFVIRSKFKNEELERLALPGVYHEELTKLIEEGLLPLADERIVELEDKREELDAACVALRDTYNRLLASPDLGDDNRNLLDSLKEKMKMIGRARARLRKDIRDTKRARDVENSELKLVAIEGKIVDMELAHQSKEDSFAIAERLSLGVSTIKNEFDDLKVRVNAELDMSMSDQERRDEVYGA